MRVKRFLPLLCLACASPQTKISYAKSVQPCATLTQELLDYTRETARDFFGEEVNVQIFVQTDDITQASCGGVSCWTPETIFVSCKETEILCNELMHELGRAEALKHYGYEAAVHAEETYPIYYTQWQGWACLPTVRMERGLNE